MYPTVEELSDELTVEQHECLPHLAFVLLRPDVLMRGQAHALVQALEERGLFAVASRECTVDERDGEELYRIAQAKRITREQRPHWWLIRQMFALTPTLVLLLAGRRPNTFASTAEFLADAKGPPNPALLEPRHLRYEFTAINAVLCVIHCADNPREVLRESRLFFSSEEFTAALAHVPDALSGRAPRPHRELTRQRDRWFMRPQRTHGFLGMLAGLKARILARLGNLEELAFPIENLRAVLERALQVDRNSPDYSTEMLALEHCCAEERALLDGFATETVSKGKVDASSELLLRWLRRLADPHRFDRVDFQELKHVLHTQTIWIDAWESLVLESSLVFHNLQRAGYSTREQGSSARTESG